MHGAPAEGNNLEVLPRYREIALVLRIVHVYLYSLVVYFVSLYFCRLAFQLGGRETASKF